MREALASYATRAAEKMRRYKVAADNLFVFMHTNTFNSAPFYSNGASARFPATTNDTGEVVSLAVRLGERLFRDGFRYAKCGVMITELLPEAVQQPALWSELDRERRERAWKTVDRLNATHPERRAEGRGLEAPGRVPVATVDDSVGRAADSEG